MKLLRLKYGCQKSYAILPEEIASLSKRFAMVANPWPAQHFSLQFHSFIERNKGFQPVTA